MNIKEWIFPLLLACSITLLVQYFWGPKEPVATQQIEHVQAGQSFTVLTPQDLQKPLQLEVEFDKKSADEQLHTVTTHKGNYTFSNQGAVLHSFTLPWNKGISTISTIESSQQFFLLALEKNTPLVYEFEGERTTGFGKEISYIAKNVEGTIKKTFVLYDNTYQIDLIVSADLERAHSVRLLLVEPHMVPAISWEKVAGLINGATKNSEVQEIDLSKEKNMHQFWAVPTNFGYTSKFLIHALVEDEHNFVQRAYFKQDQQGTLGFLESKELVDKGEWKVSFFVGPKTLKDIELVDKRLLSTMNYGWFSPISHPMLYFLNLLHEKLGSYGWAIILLTLLIKLLLLPFTIRGERSMKKNMEFQNKMAYLQQKFKDNKAELDKARAELIAKHGVPGLVGCLPMLLNIPLFIALNKVLSNAIELYGASFLWLPNLSEKDPYYILPVVIFVAMCFMPMESKDPKQSFARYAMALVVGAVATYLASGLALFIAVNTVATVAQNWVTRKWNVNG